MKSRKNFKRAVAGIGGFFQLEQEWRFYGWTGETRQIKFMTTFDLIKVYYLQADGDLTFTWVTTGVEIPGKGYQSGF
ncbi:MAG: hypothetical protein M0C28_30795 [Candidatus Moduliflexus flocculans]|nr:hypothetical protein [Candidatus Moduliflexus flocculans]